MTTTAPRRPNGFQYRMRRDPVFVAMLDALNEADKVFGGIAVGDPAAQRKIGAIRKIWKAIALAEGRPA